MSPRGEARGGDLLEVALMVLERDGLEAFSVGEVASAAGVKPPSLYKQFESKADIEAQLIEIGFRLQGATTQRALAALGPSPSRKTVLEILVHAYRDFGRRHPQLYRLMHERPLPSSLPAEVYDARATTYRSLFADPNISVSLWTWAHGLLALEIAGRYGPDVDVDRLWDILIEKATAELD